MTTVGALDPASFASRLADGGLGVRIGPFDFHLRASVAGLAQPLHALYGDYPLLDRERVFSAHVAMRETWRPRGGPRVRFSVDGRTPHEDMPRGQALAVLEWGLNLVVALRFHRFLMLHAAAVERNGRALLLPAAPGHGKTTLCAALVHRGWRLLSDEFGLLRPGTPEVVPVPRPMPLKNESIAVMRAFAPEARLGPTITGTIKGTVAHLPAPTSSVLRANEEARVAGVVFPRWEAGARLRLEPVAAPDAFLALASNAFNYETLGEPAFDTVRCITEAAHCRRLVYGDLDEAVATLDTLAGA